MSEETFYKEITVRFRDGTARKYGGRIFCALNVHETGNELVIRERNIFGKEKVTVIPKADLLPAEEIEIPLYQASHSSHIRDQSLRVVDGIRKEIVEGKIKASDANSSWGPQYRISAQDAVSYANDLLLEARNTVTRLQDEIEQETSDFLRCRKREQQDKLRKEEGAIQEAIIDFDKRVMRASKKNEESVILDFCAFCHEVKRRIFG